MGNPEIPVEKSNGTHHSIWRTSKIIGFWSKWCIIITPFGFTADFHTFCMLSIFFLDKLNHYVFMPKISIWVVCVNGRARGGQESELAVHNWKHVNRRLRGNIQNRIPPPPSSPNITPQLFLKPNQHSKPGTKHEFRGHDSRVLFGIVRVCVQENPYSVGNSG